MPGIMISATALLRQAPLTAAMGLLFLTMTVPTLVGIALDDRTIVGHSVWLKPLKFQVSLAIHLVTVALALGVLDPDTRNGWAVRVILLVVLVTSLFEGGWITLQGARGLPSHFAENLFDRAVYAMMGMAATLLVLSTALLGLLVLQSLRALAPRVVRHAVGIGLIISGTAGLITGWAIAENGGAVVGSIGVAGPEVPLLGWSRTHGDLRVAHFVGLHAAQSLPLLGLLLHAWKVQNARSVLIGASLLWAAATMGLLMQALAGHPALPLSNPSAGQFSLVAQGELGALIEAPNRTCGSG